MKTADAGVLNQSSRYRRVLGRVRASSKADYDTIVERAQAAPEVWRTTDRTASVACRCAALR